SRRGPPRGMSDGPATTTSQGPAPSRASARPMSGQALTTAPAAAWWRIRPASPPLRSTTRIRAGGPPSGRTSADQPKGVAVDREVGDVAAAEAEAEGGQYRVEQPGVDGRQDRVDEGQDGAQHAAQRKAEDVEREGERLALDEVAQPERGGADGLGVVAVEGAVEGEVARRAGQADVGAGADAG